MRFPGLFLCTSLASLASLGLGLSACGGGEERAASEPAEAASPPVISGMWKVEGTTTTKETGFERPIAGTVVLAQEGDGYTATFSMKTKVPDPEADLDAEVIGSGEGRIEGSVLEGKAETQLVVQTVPGVDTAFAYVPRMVSTRIVSSSQAELHDDGTITIQIENQPAPGEDYAATVTTLTGVRAEPRDPEAG